jgi:hypothetical protein
LLAMGKQNMAGLPARRRFENLISPLKITLFRDCTRFNLMIRFRTFCSARFRGGRESEFIKFIFIHTFYS